MKPPVHRFTLAVLCALSPFASFAMAQTAADTINSPVPGMVVLPGGPSPVNPENAVLFANGTFISQPSGGGPSGTHPLSVRMSPDGTFGFNCTTGAAGFRLADNFTVPAGGWSVQHVNVFGYQLQAEPGGSTVSPFTSGTLRIWNGPPNVAGSMVVFGDDTTNRLASTGWTGAWRVEDTMLGNLQRPIMRASLTVDQMLPPGDYWLDYSITPSTGSVFCVPNTTNNASNNSLQFRTNTSTWAAVTDTVSLRPIDLSFEIVAPSMPMNIAIANATTTEGDSGTLAMTFPVTVSPPSATPITLTVNTTNGTATAGGDYAGIAGGTFTIPANTANIDLNVTINNDVIVESDETFTVTISNASSGTIVTSQALGTIVDNDTAVLNLAPVSQPEGNAGSTAMNFTATLSRPVQGTITADFATSDLTALVSDADYTAAAGTVTFPNGVTTQTIAVQITGDTKVEAEERFTLGLTNLTRPPGINAVTLGANATVEGAIQNDDTSTLTLAGATVVEGNSGTRPLNIVLTSSNASAIPLTATVNTTNGTATAPADYVAIVGQTVTVPPGAAGQTVTIPVTVNGDLVVEGNETLTLTLSAPSAGAAIGGGPATGSISNDDTSTLSIGNSTVTEGLAGTTPAAFTVTLSAPVDRAVSFTATTSDGTANAPGDYVPLTGQSFNIAAGVTTATVTVNVNGDNVVENDETYFVTPAGLVAAPPAGGQAPLDPATLIIPANTRGTGTITNDDFTQISIGDVRRIEGTAPGAVNPFRFAMSMTNPSQLPITVQFATVDGTATAPSDYTAATGTFTFPPGSQTGEIAINVIPDDLFELDETFRVRLSNPAPAQASIARAEGVGTILNDDTVPIPANDPRALALLALLALGAGLIVLRRQ